MIRFLFLQFISVGQSSRKAKNLLLIPTNRSKLAGNLLSPLRTFSSHLLQISASAMINNPTKPTVHTPERTNGAAIRYNGR